MREPKLIIATGTRGVGKTHTTCEVIQNYIQDNPNTGKRGRKVLIYDVNREYTNEEVRKKGFNFVTQTLDIKNLPAWTAQQRVEVRRILPVGPAGEILGIDGMIELLRKILHDFKGGLLVLEDINRYLIDTKTPEIIGTMATNRHRDLDIYIHLQSLAPVTTRMWQNCNSVRFHKQMDDIARYQQRIPNAELYFIAQTLVNLRYKRDPRFYIYVDNEYSRITGKFTQKQFQVACYSYLLDHPSIISNAQKRFGKGVDSRNEAIKYCIRDLMKYCGNQYN